MRAIVSLSLLTAVVWCLPPAALSQYHYSYSEPPSPAADIQEEPARIYTRSQFKLEVIVDGKVLRETESRGIGYIEAPKDKDYQLKISCPVGERFLAVCSVDGLSVMHGKPASANDSGYIIDFGSITIPGYRLSADQVARFHFADKEHSYAAQSGYPENVGVIGVKIFSELPTRKYYSYGSHRRPSPGDGLHAPRSLYIGPGTLSRSAQGKGGPSENMPDHDLGTEFGSVAGHTVISVPFRRAEEICTIKLEYASRDQLTKAGIVSSNPSPAKW